jgi:hypothetical protein
VLAFAGLFGRWHLGVESKPGHSVDELAGLSRARYSRHGSQANQLSDPHPPPGGSRCLFLLPSGINVRGAFACFLWYNTHGQNPVWRISAKLLERGSHDVKREPWPDGSLVPRDEPNSLRARLGGCHGSRYWRTSFGLGLFRREDAPFLSFPHALPRSAHSKLHDPAGVNLEPLSDCRRLRFVRAWSDDNRTRLLTRGPGAGGPSRGSRAPSHRQRQRPPVLVRWLQTMASP